MRSDAIEMGEKLLGASGRKLAEAEWSKMKSALFGGQEPTTEALTHFDANDLLSVGVTPIFAKAWGKMFATSATPGPTQAAGIPEAEQADGFKVKRARKYSGLALATFYSRAHDDDALNAEIDRRTGGEPWVIAVAGKVLPEPSSRFIDWLAAGDEPPRAVQVDDEKVVPVARGRERQARTFQEDPSAPGERLPVDNISKVTGCDFTDVDHECRQLFRVGLGYELHGASVREKRATARSMVKKTPKDLSEDLPDAYGEFRRRLAAGTLPRLELAEELEVGLERARDAAAGISTFQAAGATDGPRAGVSGGGPLFYVLSGGVKKLERFLVYVNPLVRNGDIRLETDVGCPAGTNWRQRQTDLLAKADVVVAFVCADTIASDSFYEAVRTAYASRKSVFPIRVGAIDLTHSVFGGKVVIPRNGRVVTDDADWQEVVAEMRRILPKTRATPPSPIEVHEAILSARIERSQLLFGLDHRLVASFPTCNAPGATIMSDISEVIRAGVWKSYLQNAIHAAGPRREAEVFRRALASAE
jgi:hypothetical protein